VKKQTKAQKFNDLANAIGQIRRGEPVRRIGAKDGSIPTHPVVLVDPKLLERDVLEQCLMWFRVHRIFHNRHDVGAGDIAGMGYATYGIKNAGDIIGILKPDGKHFEIECKRGKGGRLSLGQQKRMRDVRDNGGLYFAVHGVEELGHYLGEYV